MQFVYIISEKNSDLVGAYDSPKNVNKKLGELEVNEILVYDGIINFNKEPYSLKKLRQALEDHYIAYVYKGNKEYRIYKEELNEF